MFKWIDRLQLLLDLQDFCKILNTQCLKEFHRNMCLNFFLYRALSQLWLSIDNSSSSLKKTFLNRKLNIFQFRWVSSLMFTALTVVCIGYMDFRGYRLLMLGPQGSKWCHCVVLLAIKKFQVEVFPIAERITERLDTERVYPLYCLS